MAETKNILGSEIMGWCRRKLSEVKVDLLNRLMSAKTDFDHIEWRGDEADQTVAQLTESDFLRSQRRLREQLLEVEYALARIENGQYGICEETHEPIEIERLRAIPWTRLSIEGAEIREATRKSFAKGNF